MNPATAGTVRREAASMIGSKISHFRILDRIGEGGMGVVYRAEDVELHRHVALKVLRRDFVGNAARRARFLREGRTAAKINHPSIATIHEIGEAQEEIFIAMELVRGRSLKERIGGRPMPVEQAVGIATQIAGGLAAAHAAQVLHRDLKPANVVLGEDGRVKILDFGLAKLLERAAASASRREQETLSDLATGEGKILGTVAYMSPEQARGKPVDLRSDIFSFGITLYEMLTGQAPFRGETPSDTLASILKEEPRPPIAAHRHVPPALVRIVERCLHKRPEERYQSARELAADLHALQSGSNSQSVTIDSDSGSSVLGPASTSSWESGLRPAARSARLWTAGVAVAALAIATGFFVPRIADRGTAVVRAERIENSLAVMPFQNLKDPSDPQRFGQILQELIITDLSGLNPLKVFSSQRLYDVQKQVGGPDEAQIDRELSTKIARGAGAHSILEGSLSQLGTGWILTAHLIDVDTGTVLASQRIDGQDLYTMVDELTERLRGDLQVTMSGPALAASVREKTSASLDAYRHFIAGVELLNQGRYEAAADSLRVAIEHDPGFGQAYYKQAMALWWEGHSADRAKQQLTQILTRGLYSNRLERLMAEAGLALISRDWEEAIPLYRQVAEQFPDEKEGWYGLGEALFHSGTGDEEETLAAFEKAIALDPSFTLAYRHVFDISLQRGAFREALARAKEFIRAHPENPVGYSWWVSVATRWGDEAEIDAAMREARARASSPEELRRILVDAANGYRMRHDLVEAERLYEEARRIDPEGVDFSWLSGFGGTLFRLGRSDEARALFAEHAKLLDENQDLVKRTEVEFLLGAGETQHAIEKATRRLEEDPEEFDNLILLAQGLVRTGAVERVRAIRDSLERAETDPEKQAKFLRSIGSRLFTEMRFDLGREWLESGLSLDPEGTEPESRLPLGF
ncbi:MAG: protein kinase, partial [Candidatus Eisenbacteria bacterium]|nr:protein kinase [Candidatus Latescibacterota bacterium]MBD3302041.1 protein kinase [Candidatus Eisenbacteria bacterium]